MTRMEIHPGEGGEDAQTFAAELATAISKHAGVAVQGGGTTLTLHRL